MKITISDGKLELKQLTDLITELNEICKSKEQDLTLNLSHLTVDVYKHLLTIDELITDTEI